VFWASFEIPTLEAVMGVGPETVLEAGRWTDWMKLPTVVASGTRSWNTSAVVFDESLGGEGYGKVPLFTVEMERAMGMPDGFTEGFGFGEMVQHRMIGNAFHVGVMQHILRNWVLALREFDSTLGFPGEGPTEAQKRRRRKACRELGQVAQQVAPPHVVGSADEAAGPGSIGVQLHVCLDRPAKRQQRSARRQQAAWRSVVPLEAQRLTSISLASVFDAAGWGNAERQVLPVRASRATVVEVPTGEGFRSFVDQMIHDLVLSSRAQGTWKVYKAWVEVFFAFLGKFELDTRPCEELWAQWVEVLLVAVAVLSQCYSLSTVSILASAVSAFTQDYGMRTPYESRLFQMVMRGLPRYLGAGVTKKPPVEAWHVAEIVKMQKPAAFTWLQWLQGLAVVLLGWELFTRSQDFSEFQICDFIRLDKGLRVFVRYAKNDQKGLTRAPLVEDASNEVACPVKVFLRYVSAAGLKVQHGCNKVEGEPERCSVCPPAFPAITKHGGIQSRPMPKSRVTEIMRVFFLEMADKGLMTEEQARAFSSKSLRCGGVSQATAEAVRDGVVQGHGGWLQRQSLVHYDLMRPGEAPDVSRALNKAVGRFLSPID